MRIPGRLNVIGTALLATATIFGVGCSNANQVGASAPQPGGGGELGKKGSQEGGGSLGTGEQNPGGDGQQNILDPNAKLFEAKYEIKVKSLFGITVCEGEADIEVGLKFDFKPVGQVKCLFNAITIDLEKMLAGLDNGTEQNPGVEVDDHVLYFGNLAGTDFSPPRPLLVSPFSATKKEMRRIRTSDRHSVKTVDGKSGSGEITLDVVGVDESFAPDNMDYVFTKILHWRISTTGFEGVKSKGLLFEEMEFFWNLDPIAIPRLKLKGHIKDFLGEGGLGDLAGGGGQDGQGGGGLGGILGGLGGGGQGGGGGLFDIFKNLAVDIAGDFDIDIQLKEMDGLDLDDDDD